MALVFIPTTILTIAYIFTGYMQPAIPSILLFFLLAVVTLFPFEVAIVLNASKKEYGKFSLKSAFNCHNKMSLWKILMYGTLLFGFAGIMSITIAPLENNLFAPLSNKFAQLMPEYFNWNNIEQLKQYSKEVLFVTCVGYSICNVVIGPIIEELFFRGYLTSKISRLGAIAPLIITVLFSMYHFWLPFNNLFRICAFSRRRGWLGRRKTFIYRLYFIVYAICYQQSVLLFLFIHNRTMSTIRSAPYWTYTNQMSTITTAENNSVYSKQRMLLFAGKQKILGGVSSK